MGHARDHLQPESRGDRRKLHILFPGDERSVRVALKTAMGVLRGMDLGEDTSGDFAIVLAEVRNNVVEHAYADHGRGIVEVQVEHMAEHLAFRIIDDGRPMPGGEIPAGHAHDLEVAAADLPEGGFGWFLIRELTEDLHYTRWGSRNELSFRIPIARAILAN